MFKTQQEAEAELHARKVVAKLRQQPGRKGFKFDDANYSITVSLTECTFVDYWNTTAHGFAQTYFKTAQDAENAIKAVGADEILKAAKWLAMGVTGE